MKLDLGLEGRSCLVTGGSRGIGAETALMLAAEHADVLIVGRDRAAMDEVVARAGGGVAGLAVDLTDPGAIAAITARGPFDVVVNNAGSSTVRELAELEERDWQFQWELNVLVPLRLAQAFHPEMARRGWGRIVNVSSASAKRPTPKHQPYSVTKAAMLSLSRVLAEEYAGDGVLVNAVAPGPVASDFWMGRGGAADQLSARMNMDHDDIVAAVEAAVPIGRFAAPAEVAAVIVFLCSAACSTVCGAAWSADGGAAATIL